MGKPDVTLELLRNLPNGDRACDPAQEAFAARFPDGCSYRELLLALAEHPDGIEWWEWLWRRLSDMKPVRDKYYASVDHRAAWAAYDAARTVAWELRNTTHDAVWETYDGVVNAEWVVYKAAVKTAWEAYYAERRPILKRIAEEMED